MTNHIAILGGGKIGEALLSGLRRGGPGGSGGSAGAGETEAGSAGSAGSAGDIVVTERDAERAEFLRETYGVRIAAAPDAVRGAATVIVATKPHDVATVVADIADTVTPEQLVVSVAAGVTSAAIERGLPAGLPVVRAMPNTPALVGEGMTAIAPGAHATDDHLAAAERLLSAVGRVVRVPESQLDAVTALSGSGPAYLFYVVESLIDAGVLLGLPRPLATELVVQTAAGAATMLRESGEHPVALREAVTSPGGTTAAAVRALEAHGVRAGLGAAAEAAAARSRELGAER